MLKTTATLRISADMVAAQFLLYLDYGDVIVEHVAGPRFAGRASHLW
jgi:hypothetical protein